MNRKAVTGPARTPRSGIMRSKRLAARAEVSSLQRAVGSTGTVFIATRCDALDDLRKALPEAIGLEVLRFLDTRDLGRLGRTGTALRTLSLRSLMQLPGDYRLQRMAAPDRRVFFRSDAHKHVQWEKPTRAKPPPLPCLDPTGRAQNYPPWITELGASAPATKRVEHLCDYRSRELYDFQYVDYSDLDPTQEHKFWQSVDLRHSQWELPCYEDLPNIFYRPELGGLVKYNWGQYL